MCPLKQYLTEQDLGDLEMCLGATPTCFRPVNKHTVEGLTFHNRTTICLGESHQNVNVRVYWDFGIEQNTIVTKSYKNCCLINNYMPFLILSFIWLKHYSYNIVLKSEVYKFVNLLMPVFDIIIQLHNFSLSFFPPKPPIKPCLLCFKCMSSFFFTNCYCMYKCICIYFPKYNHVNI